MAEGSQYKQYFSDVPDEELLKIPLVRHTYAAQKVHLEKMSEITGLTPVQCAFELVIANKACSHHDPDELTSSYHNLAHLVDYCSHWRITPQGDIFWGTIN